jgi:DNA-binding transcriptional regulator WhiA
MEIKIFEIMRLDRHFKSTENDSKDAFEIIQILRKLRKSLSLECYIEDANIRRTIQTKLDAEEEKEEEGAKEEIAIIVEKREPSKWSEIKQGDDAYVFLLL